MRIGMGIGKDLTQCFRGFKIALGRTGGSCAWGRGYFLDHRSVAGPSGLAGTGHFRPLSRIKIEQIRLRLDCGWWLGSCWSPRQIILSSLFFFVWNYQNQYQCLQLKVVGTKWGQHKENLKWGQNGDKMQANEKRVKPFMA